MADSINSATQNEDGSWVFNFTFDNGSGVLGNTNVVLPAPEDGVETYTPEAAKAAVLPIATAQKAAWVAALGVSVITGTVTL
jgi:hypothetical protein